MYLCIYVYMYVCMYVCMYVVKNHRCSLVQHFNILIYFMYVCMYVCMYVFLFMYVYVKQEISC